MCSFKVLQSSTLYMYFVYIVIAPETNIGSVEFVSTSIPKENKTTTN